MRTQRAGFALALASVMLGSGLAHAEALDLYELDTLAAMLACQDACRASYPTFYETDCKYSNLSLGLEEDVVHVVRSGP